MTDRDRKDELSHEQLQELNRIRDEFEQALRENRNPAIETEIASAPAGIREALLIELLRIEIAFRARAELMPDVNEYQSRFPNRQEEIQAIFFRLSETFSRGEQITEAIGASDQHVQTTTNQSSVAAGVHIGSYKLLQPIGEGGMGTVWLAEQFKPVRRTVALKIIKAGMDTREVIARFEAERQALALMNHPNIAKVLDAGETREGRPYFVMELVKGVTITKFCDEHRLSSAQRLKLFTAVCRAVQHAHQKGIIHRDIKPTNVLVAQHDDEPNVKVIDFGLAKATGHSLIEKTAFTAFGQLVGTPAYMSPEQAEGRGLDIDTRTDVYSLGVLLYELLTGVTPLDVKSIRAAGFAEMQRMIREQSPPPMSSRLSSLGADSQVIAQKRATDSKRLAQALRGDLDLIVMKALEKDRNRRYESPSSFAADIERFMKNEAIEARPASAVYRLKKLIRRNKTAVFTTSFVALALLLGTVVSTWQALVARQQRDLAVAAQESEAEQRKAADEQRDRAVIAEDIAQQRAAELQMVADFQAEMLQQIDTNQAGKLLSDDVIAKFSEALQKDQLAEEEKLLQVESFERNWNRINATDAARNLIDRTILTPAIEAIDNQFQDQPVVAARLKQTLANLYRDIGLYDAALPLQTDALTTRRRVLGDQNADTLYSITNMGVLLQTQGKLVEAEPYYQESLDKRRSVLGEEHPDTLISINNMGFLLQSQGKLDEAERYYREALEKRRRILGEDHELTIASVSNMGFLLQSQGKLDDAEPYWQEALVSSRRVLGDEHPSTLTAINNLGYLLRALKKFAEAEPLHYEALEKRRQVLGEEHPDTLNSINNLGILLANQGKLSEAVPYFLEALEKRRRVLGEEHPSTLTSINNMGSLLRMLGRVEEAEPYIREALENKRRMLGDEHPSTIGSIVNMGALLLNQNKLTEAEPYLREALEKYLRVHGDEHPNTLTAMSLLGTLLLAQGNDAEAEPFIREALEKRRSLLGDDDPDTLISIRLLGSLLHVQGSDPEAIALLSPIEEKSRSAFTSSNAYRLGELLVSLGKARIAVATVRSEFEVAEFNLLEAHEIYQTNPSPSEQDRRDGIQAIVDLYNAWNDVEKDKGYAAKADDWASKLEQNE